MRRSTANPSTRRKRQRRENAAGSELTGSEEEARVAVRVEALLLLNRVAVGGLPNGQAHQGADQHEQGRARQVEVGDESVHGLESVSRRDEDRRVAFERANDPILAGRT